MTACSAPYCIFVSFNSKNNRCINQLIQQANFSIHNHRKKSGSTKSNKHLQALFQFRFNIAFQCFDSINQQIANKTMIFQTDNQEETNLNYQLKKIMHMIELQIMDIESTLHYIQKKHTVHQIKEVLSQIYNVFNQSQVVFKYCKAIFLHTTVKKLMSCFGIIYFMLTDNIENGKISQKHIILNDNTIKDITNAEQVNKKDRTLKTRPKTEHNDVSQVSTNYRPFGGVYLYNQNYIRNICSNNDSTHNKAKNEKKAVLTKDEFNKQIMDQLNDNFLNIPHPDEILDIFTFKFKYGREKEVVTFHDQLQSIAKFFKDSQNQAFQFLNKTKNQNSNLTYNDTFSDIMGQVKLQKEIKLQEFTKKIKNVFKSIKSKTENKWSQIETKLQEVKQIKNSIKPPENKDIATQTIYNIDEEIKYLKKKIESLEEKYELMQEMKRKEVQENTLMQIQMQNQLGLKARQLIYLKIALDQNKVVITNLNKKIKMFSDNRKKIKQSINLSSINNTKEEGIKKLVEIVEAQEAVSENTTQEEKISLYSLRKQKKMAKKLVADARRRSLAHEKQQYSKRYTQQMEGMNTASKQMLQKWGLSQILQQDDMQTFSIDQSVATNKNNQLNRQNNSKKNTKMFFNPHQTQIPIPSMSSHSVKSSNEQKKTRKQTQYKPKTNSQFVSMKRPGSFLSSSQTKQQNFEDSLICQSDSDQSDGHNQDNEEDMRRLQEMYKRQMNKTKNSVLERKSALLSQMNQRSLTKSKFKTDQNSLRKSESNIIDHYGSKGSLIIPKSSNISPRYPTSSFKLSQMNSIDEKEQDRQVDLQTEIKKIQNQNKQLLQLLDKKNKMSLTFQRKQIDLTIQPLPSQKSSQFRKTLNLKSEVEEQTYYSNIRTDKKGQLRFSKEKKVLHFKESKTATQFMSRPATQSKLLMKLNSQNFNLRRAENNQKCKTDNNAQSQSNVSESLKHTQQMLSKSKSEFGKNILGQKSKTLQSQKEDELQKQRNNLIKKSLYGKQNKGSLMTNQKTMLQRLSQIQALQRQKKEDIQEETKVKQLASHCKSKKQFKNKIYQIHWQRCGKSCKHLEQYMNNFLKYRQQAKIKLKMHVQNIHNSIESPPQLPVVNKKK